jgi:hypothetical protein
MTLPEAEAEIVRLQRLNAGLVDRIAMAAEVMGKVANRLPVCRCELEAVIKELLK